MSAQCLLSSPTQTFSGSAKEPIVGDTSREKGRGKNERELQQCRVGKRANRLLAVGRSRRADCRRCFGGFGNNGTYKGNPTFAQVGAIVNDPNTAIGCNGPNSKDYVEIPDPGGGSQAVFSQPTSSLGFTVEAWMRPDTLVFPVQPSGPDFYTHWLVKCASGSGQCEWG